MTPHPVRERIRWVKYHLFGRFSGAVYWNLAARISAMAAIHTDCVKESEFFKSGDREASLLRSMGMLDADWQVLDIGCGIGRIEKAICGEVRAILGVDVSSRMVELARGKVPADNVSFQTVNGDSLDEIKSEQFDLCISFMVLQHIPRESVARYIVEVNRILKPGGKFLFQIPIKTGDIGPEPPLSHPFGIRYYLPEEVEHLLRRAGLKPLERTNASNQRAPIGVEGLRPEYEYFLAERPALEVAKTGSGLDQ